jgi:RalA-binding protein 1
MILGLNKDLERALKDKEKYRSKLKEVMANPAVSKTTSIRGDTTKDPRKQSNTQVPPIDVRMDGRMGVGPDSPLLDSPTTKQSPIDSVLAPYPITPPADHSAAVTRSAAPTEPPQLMPNAHEHAHNKFDHEAEDKASDQARKAKNEEPLKDIHYITSLPPSRGLPPDPPKVPPPKPPTGAPPSVSIVEATPRPDEGLASFPSPPRKGPPPPLQLTSPVRENAIVDDDDTDSDLDDILRVAEAGNEKRGRRRTRAEDDYDREIRAFKEAEARSVSKKSKSSQPDPASIAMPVSPRTIVPPVQQHIQAGTASLAAVLRGDESQDLGPPLMSPGLPASPRPNPNMKMSLASPPLSPRGMGSFPAAPLSPRPPRQPIPLPPNTPLATPAVTGADGATSQQPLPHRGAKPPTTSDSPNQTGRSSPAERTRIYKGLVTEEYPDLLLPPNALPSIAISVASSRMKPSRASLISLTQLEEDPVFTLAVISRSDGGELWRVEKDSASLSKLDSRLKQCAAFTAKTPDRALFSGHAPAKVDARRVALEQYMDELLNTPLDISTALEFCKYLSTNTLPPNADEMGGPSGGAREGSSHMIGPDGRPIRSGYLTKRGKNFGGWKSRFFLLDGPLLRYYETPGGAHLGTIKLQNAQIGKQSHGNDKESPSRGNNGDEADNQYRHAFLILEPKRKDSSSHVKHVLCAENDTERDLWVDALLQWIDYRDPDDEDTAPTTKPSNHAHGGGKGRKGSQPTLKSHHQAGDSDPLVSVKYDSTQAGDAPQSGKPKMGGGPGDQVNLNDTLTSQTSKLISGPKDAQVISDAAAWGNKTGLAVPSYEEKKARKRSFFGFGPKTRSNSDGQESITPAHDAFSSSTPPQASYQGPVRQAFGAPLAEAVRYSSPTDVRVPLPAVVYRCIQYLDSKDAVLEEGIFRLSGSNLLIKQLRERFNTEGDINLVNDEQYYDIHAVASLLKLYLRELPTTILTRDLHNDFLRATEITDRNDKMAALNELAQRLPLPNATLLQYLISFLIKIINNADMNKMTVRNVGIVFSPTLNIPAPVFALFLQNYEVIFGIAPEKYELPTLGSDTDSQGRYESPVHFEAPPQRPSTAGTGASPHRQPPRIDSMRDYQRSTPTPPLISGLNAGRGSLTPPLGAGRQGYDAAPQGQQQAYNQRPAYEAGYNVAPQQDNYKYPPHRGGPHDRSGTQPSQEDSGGSLQVQDQSQGNRRRESAMFMGNLMSLQQQGSKSRLREESHF